MTGVRDADFETALARLLNPPPSSLLNPRQTSARGPRRRRRAAPDEVLAHGHALSGRLEDAAAAEVDRDVVVVAAGAPEQQVAALDAAERHGLAAPRERVVLVRRRVRADADARVGVGALRESRAVPYVGAGTAQHVALAELLAREPDGRLDRAAVRGCGCRR